jgi:hypothetical protein
MLLSQSGHWLSGTDATVTVSWASTAREATPASRLVWQLNLDGVALAKGEAALKPPAEGGQGGAAAVITTRCPDVRTRVGLRLAWRLLRVGDGGEIERGELPVVAYPRDLTSGWAKLTANRAIVVIDRPAGLPRVLDAAHVQYARADDPAALGLSRPDVILVGAEMLDDSPFTQAPLAAQARAGASVMIFRQSRPQRLAEYPVSVRALPAGLEWERQHRLLARFDADDLKDWPTSWAGGGGGELRALDLPADDPSVAVVAWPSEVPQQPGAAPVTALLVTKAVGAGRLVLCQMPLGDPTSDPRAQVFLGNALDYLLSRPEPTPPPSRRRHPETRPTPPPTPTITIPSGAKP